jgi:hypothetical protein
MKFQKLEKINLRNETKRYFADIVNFNRYNLYFGVTNNFFSVLISVDEIDDEVELDSWDKIMYNNHLQNQTPELMDKLLASVEKSGDKSIEFYNPNRYLKFPVSLDLIDWLKAEIVIFEESKQDYQKISLPYINSILEKNIRWINELVFNKSEEIIVLERTSEYVICKDIVWKEESNSQFYILAIPTKSIKTIRELNVVDIGLLEELKSKCIQIAKSYGVPKEKLYMYFHYHPSYYQLHLHVCITEHPALETKLLRHYQLDTVINKLKTEPDYWKNATLKFELLTGTKLFNLLKEKGTTKSQ